MNTTSNAQLSEEEAVAMFHLRTRHEFSQVRDRSLMGRYAREKGWYLIAEALLPTGVEDSALTTA